LRHRTLLSNPDVRSRRQRRRPLRRRTPRVTHDPVDLI
jgi:hypothetical protein